MRIQIVHDDGTLLHVPVLNQHLERDIRELFNGKIPWWRWLRRLHARWALNEIEKVTEFLRESTRL